MVLNLLLALLAAHLLVEGYVRVQSIRWRSALYALLVWIPLLLLTDSALGATGVAFALGALRAALYAFTARRTPATLALIVVEQAGLVIALVATSLGLSIAAHATEMSAILTWLCALFTPAHIAILLAYALILKPCSLLIEKVLKRYALNEAADEHNGLKAGGELIGYLERFLILTFLLQGEYAVIGFILTAKSIFRFGELSQSENRRLTEYVLLGSLLSVTLTAMISLLVAYFYS